MIIGNIILHESWIKILIMIVKKSERERDGERERERERLQTDRQREADIYRETNSQKDNQHHWMDRQERKTRSFSYQNSAQSSN